MQNPIKIKIEKVYNYGEQYHQNHYSIHAKLKMDVPDLSLSNGDYIWVNIWLSPKNEMLNQQLIKAGSRDYTGVGAQVDIKQNKQFYNCKTLEFDDPQVYLSKKG